MSECTHDCSSCGESCADRQGGSPFQIKPLHEGCHVRKVYGVVSGKGGVGKSMVTSQLAVTMQRRGYRTAVLDADITGPSIPKAFGLTEKAGGTESASRIYERVPKRFYVRVLFTTCTKIICRVEFGDMSDLNAELESPTEDKWDDWDDEDDEIQF